jgi:hypothetical protein
MGRITSLTNRLISGDLMIVQTRHEALVSVCKGMVFTVEPSTLTLSTERRSWRGLGDVIQGDKFGTCEHSFGDGFN